METVSPNSLSGLTVFMRVEQFQIIALQILYSKIPNQLAGNKTCRVCCFTSGTWLKKREIKT